MVLKRCPQCGTTSDDQYGFCLKCGHEFPQIKPEANNCPFCGYENPDEATFCVKCGTPLIFGQHFQNPQSDNPVVIKYSENSKKTSDIGDYKPTSMWTILFGYIFSILGGIIGLIIAIYLSTRKDPIARKHGHIQLGILVFYLILILTFVATGNITMADFNNYTQMLAGNFTR